MTQSVQVVSPKPRKKLYQVAATTYSETKGTLIVLQPMTVLAKDEESARLMAAKLVPDLSDDEELEIHVVPF